MKNIDIIHKCFENICKNYNIPAGLHISGPVLDRNWHDIFRIFIDVHAGSCLNIYNKEVWMNILNNGIKSKKDYRKLRSLIKIRLIDSLYSLRNLINESLHNLGEYKCQEN